MLRFWDFLAGWLIGLGVCLLVIAGGLALYGYIIRMPTQPQECAVIHMEDRRIDQQTEIEKKRAELNKEIELQTAREIFNGKTMRDPFMRIK